MAKRILLAVMCTLLALVVVMGGIVFDKVNTLLSVAQPPQSTPGASTGQTDPPATSEATEPEQSRPTEPPHEHNLVLKESISATCTAFGYNVYTCACGKTYLPNEEYTNPLGHDYVAGETVELTCTQDGYTPYTCTRCEDVDKRDYQEAEGHHLESETVVPPTCDEEGYTTGFCTVCEEDVIYDIVQPNGHEYGEWNTTNEAGDAIPGKKERICGTCGGVDTELIPPTGTLEIKNQTVTTLTDNENVEYQCYVITVGTELTPDAYTYTINSYVNDQLTFVYDEDGLSVFVDGFPEDELKLLEPYEDGQWTLKIEEPEEPEEPEDPEPPNTPEPPETPGDQSEEQSRPLI